MAILPIYTDGSPVLREKAKPVKQLTDDVIALIINMFETMRKANGIGLAANQVGILKRIIVVDVSEMEGLEDIKPLALINPEIINKEGSCVLEEGCLSVPGIHESVERPKSITIRYKDTNFKTIELEATDTLARVILHEIDHLDGVLFIDYLSPDQKTHYEDELQKIRHGEVEVDYPVITAVDAGV
jgi:peptide deformylase